MFSFGKKKTGGKTNSDELISNAIEADMQMRAGKSQDTEIMNVVYDMYFIALETKMAEIKEEMNPSVKEQMKLSLLTPMDRLEELKKQIDKHSKKSDNYDYTARASLSSSSSSSSSLSSSSFPLPTSSSISSLFILPPSQRPSPGSFHPSTSKQQVAPTSAPSSILAPASTVVAPITQGNSKTLEYETQIRSDMLDSSPGVSWDDIAGLSFAKQMIQETVILPNLRPDIFTGLRSPPKGLLLYGPPGTGKTLLAKAVATESGFSFFNITASSVSSKYVGEGEKLIKILFEIARKEQPSVIFLDEIDALMGSRKDSEHEASRRLKTEFMVQVDGAATTSDDRILIIGATNVPWDLDEAVLRRLTKRIYIPLPDNLARRGLIDNLFKKHAHVSSGKGKGSSKGWNLSDDELAQLIILTEGYSGSDLSAMCKEAAMGPVRELGPAMLKTVRADDMRPICFDDFIIAVQNIRPSVSAGSLGAFLNWGNLYGVSK